MTRAPGRAAVVMPWTLPLAVTAVALLAAPGAWAQGAGTHVVAFSGGFTTAVPIGVPPARGLEPKVQLVYTSSAANGFVGVGWSLVAGSTIERASPGRGAPRYDSSDIYLLDGLELIPCAPGSISPSCTTGGTHSTRVENYQRIQWDAANNRWLVWSKEGVKLTYASRHTTSLGGTFRWNLTSRQDAKANTVNYNWICLLNQYCWLERITYTGGSVVFFAEGREQVMFAIGQGMGSMNIRLKGIAVRAGNNALVRAYKLTYYTSATTGRSTLADIRQYGRDATVNYTTGDISGGTALNAFHASWRTAVAGFGSDGWSPAIDWGYDEGRAFVDFNGDGKADYCRVAGPSNGGQSYVLCDLSTGGGLHGGTIYSPTIDVGYTTDRAWVDFNGDGKADYCRRVGSNQIACTVSTGTGFGATSYSGWVDWGYAEGRAWVDFNGDGKADYCRIGGASGGYYVVCNPSTGTGFGDPVYSASLNPGATSFRAWADFDGDGRADFCRTIGSTVACTVAKGTGFGETYTSGTLNVGQTTGRQMADLNGDGKADFCRVQTDNYLACNLSTGRGWQEWIRSSAPRTAGDTAGRAWVDFNGDGRADYCRVTGASGAKKLICAPSTGTGYGADVTSGTLDAGYDAGRAWADLNGDGRPDYCRIVGGTNFTNAWATCTLGGSPSGDLVNNLWNGMGGNTTITYVPSSTWENTLLPLGVVFPTVSSIVVDDGRGDAQTTNYSYRGASWSIPTREFLGFRKSTTTLAATGAYSETYYWQREGTIAKPEVIYRRRADGKVLSFETFRFTENPSAPYTSLVTEIWSYECNGQGVFDANGNYVSGCRRVLATYGWDEYGNLTTENQYGDYDLGGDERTVERSFAANTSAYIVGLPAYELIRYDSCAPRCVPVQLDYVRYGYDGQASGVAPTVGLFTKKERWNDVLGAYETHTFGYDTWGNQTSMIDPLGHTATKEYDTTYHLYPTATVNPLGHRMTTGYDYGFGLVTSKTDPNGNTATYAYDALGRITLEAGPDGSQRKYEYLDYDYGPYAQRNRMSVKLPGGAWAWDDSYFDGNLRVYKRTSSNGVTAEIQYGPTGHVWKRSLPYAAGETVRWDVFTYDELGRQLTETKPNGAVLTTSYGIGERTLTDALGAQRTAWHDAHGRLTKVREVIGGVNRDTTFAYDRLGRRTRAVDALGNVSAVLYDSVGHSIQRTDPDHGVWTYEYNLGGQLVGETNAAGQRTALYMDTLGRVTRRFYPGGTSDRYTFDETGRGASKGRLTTATSAAGVITRAAYDTMGRRTWYQQVVDGVTKTISHTFDLTGRVATLTYPDGEVVSHVYGTSGVDQGRLSAVTGKVSKVTYTARGQVRQLSFANGVTTTYDFDSWGERPTQVTFGTLATIAYGYDLAGRITSLTSGQLAHSWGYSYDELGRLTRAIDTPTCAPKCPMPASESFTYDALGRMVASTRQGTMTYGSSAHVHAVTATSSTTYGYDANGNMTSGGGRTLSYDGAGRPVTITSGGLTTTFVYDALGQRVKKSSSQGTVVYVGGVYETRNGVAVKHYFAGGLRVARHTAAEGVVYLHADHLGSTRLATNAIGLEVRRLEYSPFGVTMSSTGTATINHRYTGQEADDETGLLFYRARYYDPALGRFIQPDGIVPDVNNPQDLDPYAYVYNSPVNNVDPSGNAAVAAAIAIAAWLGLGAGAAVWITAAIVAITVVGVAMTLYGNETWQTVGMVLAGVGGALLGAGPLLGLGWGGTVAVAAGVALAQSPISPLDPNIKKAIGWAYAIWGGITNLNELQSGLKGSVLGWKGAANWAQGSWWRSAAALAGSELLSTGGAMLFAAMLSGQSDDARYAFGFIAACLVTAMSARPGPLAMIGATYDLAYSLKYPDGRVVDLTNGAGGDEWIFYYHTGYSSGMAFGRQHIRVRDPLTGQYCEIGDGGPGWFPVTLGWGGWASISKVTVIMSPAQSASFRAALTMASATGGTYWMYHTDSYTFIQAAFEQGLSSSFASLHVNPGLFHWP